jgi:hypothetical protein
MDVDAVEECIGGDEAEHERLRIGLGSGDHT